MVTKKNVGLVKSRVELKVSFTHSATKKEKGEKTLGTSKKTSGKIVKAFIIGAVEDKELRERVSQAVSILEGGSKGLSKAQTKNIEKELKKKIKEAFDAEKHKLVDSYVKKEKELNDIIESKNQEIDLLKSAPPVSNETESTTEGSGGENEVDGQPIKPTKS